MKLGQTLQLIGYGTQTKRVVRTVRVRPDMPRHEAEIVCKGFVAADGCAMPFAAVLTEINDIHACSSVYESHQTHMGMQSPVSKTVEVIRNPVTENFNPKRREV